MEMDAKTMAAYNYKYQILLSSFHFKPLKSWFFLKKREYMHALEKRLLCKYEKQVIKLSLNKQICNNFNFQRK